MKLNYELWSNDIYNDFIDYLYSIKDEKYQKFHYRLLKNDDIDLIGIRTPQLHKIAKEISKGDYLSFFKSNTLKTYEEKTIYGLIIGYLKLDFIEISKLLDKFIPNIDNWATCDLVCSNLKIFKNNQSLGFEYIKKIIANPSLWSKRFGIVLLLDYYVNEKYIDEVLALISDIKDCDYYVEMAIAWLLSVAYIKYQDKVLMLLKGKNISTRVIKMTVKKVNESYRVSLEDKHMLKINLYEMGHSI